MSVSVDACLFACFPEPGNKMPLVEPGLVDDLDLIPKRVVIPARAAAHTDADLFTRHFGREHSGIQGLPVGLQRGSPIYPGVPATAGSTPLRIGGGPPA